MLAKDANNLILASRDRKFRWILNPHKPKSQTFPLSSTLRKLATSSGSVPILKYLTESGQAGTVCALPNLKTWKPENITARLELPPVTNASDAVKVYIAHLAKKGKA